MVLPNEDGADTIDYAGRETRLLSVWPLHADEMQLKLDKGAERLYDLLDDASITEILHADRPSLVPRRRRGWFRS